jgi:acyl-CoA synthetase (AMP-forming)/AMP-acid ligase II
MLTASVEATPAQTALVTRLLDALVTYADDVAITDRTVTKTYRELDTDSRSLSESMRAAVGSDDDGARHRVLIAGPNSYGLALAFVATMRAGMIPLLADPTFGEVGLRVLADSCGARVLLLEQDITALADGELRAELLNVDGSAPEPLPSTTFGRFTSGSTRQPACIEFDGDAALAAAAAWTDASYLSGSDRILCFAGLYNGLAFNTSFIPALLAGASLVLMPPLASGGLVHRLVGRHRPTILVGFPALFDSLARSQTRGEFGDLRLALSSAARLTKSVHARLREVHGIAVNNYYGIAEVGPVTFNHAGSDDDQGTFLTGVEAEIRPLADGVDELLVRTTSMGSRYLNYPGELESRVDADGFFRTGDAADITAGRLKLGRRLGGALNIGGRKVSSDEIVRALRSVPGVDDAVVFALSRSGEDRLAAVVESRTLTEQAVRGALADVLEPSRRPEFLAVVPDLPRGGAGKASVAQARTLFETTIGGSTHGRSQGTNRSPGPGGLGGRCFQ